jgi:ATP/maltotriose-dependent transcriptional regulator MalT
MSPSTPAGCVAGNEALSRGAWVEARDAFTAALRIDETPEALEGLGLAAWWLDSADVVFDTRERAYRLYLERDERRAAARIAVWLAWDCWAFRGENVVANGWLQRARRLLEGEPDCSERAWLELREGSLCLLEEGDPDRAHAMAAEGMRVARAVGNNDLEMLGRAIQGLALVASGAVAEGMRGLDEVNAAVVAGELKDLVAIGLSCCYMIAACDRVRDYDRAVQWCTRLKAFCATWGLRPLFAVCRTQYASICMWRGTWLEAEAELISARDELAASRPAMTADAVVRLAELRRRQGRLTEAAALLDQVEPHGLALLGRAELAYDRADWRAAAEQAARYLAHMAAGWVALGSSNGDDARRHFEDAVDGFLESGAPFEVARAGIELARALVMLERREAAAEEAQRAIDLLSELKAELELARARDLLGSISSVVPAGETTRRPVAGLTKREIEVLRLVADGLNNQAIAERLFVSDHTIHRHLSNILNKLSVSSRAAAVAQAARRGLLT